jgi:hypothetical protein
MTMTRCGAGRTGARLRFLLISSATQTYQGHSYTREHVEELGTFPSASPSIHSTRSAFDLAAID